MKLRIFTEPQQGASYDDQLAVARCAEEEGFDAFFRSDHYLAFAGDGLPGPTDAWVTLAGLARDTTRIRLGTLLTPVTFRRPGPLAISVAQVDAMSGGRVELGLGAGWFDGEHRAYGIPFPPMAERFGRLAEQLQIITGLWGTAVGDKFDFQGTYYSVEASPGLPKPVQTPRPPVIVGGAGARRTPELAARYADEFNTPFLNPTDAAGQIARVRRACEDAGRDPAGMRFSSAMTVCCGRDEGELAARARAIGQPLEHLRAYQLAGTPEEVAARLAQYAEAGSTTAYLQVLDLHDLDHVRLIAREVAPRLT